MRARIHFPDLFSPKFSKPQDQNLKEVQLFLKWITSSYSIRTIEFIIKLQYQQQNNKRFNHESNSTKKQLQEEH